MPSEPILEQFMQTLTDDLRANGVDCHLHKDEHGVQTRLAIFMPLVRPMHLILADSELYITKEWTVIRGGSSTSTDADIDEDGPVNRLNLTDPEFDPNLFKSLIFDMIRAQNKMLQFIRN